MPQSLHDKDPMHLFAPLTLRSVTLRNRIAVSPMCQYSAENGRATDWHLVHLGSRAVGGAGLVVFEATAVEPRGRISPADLGLWEDAQVEPLARIVRFIEAQGAVSCLQMAHAGRKADTAPPWKGGSPLSESSGGWQPVAPSAIAFAEGHTVPQVLDEEEIHQLVRAFAAAARRALAAGFRILELHMAHGYLIHQFLSPLSNRRMDKYGGPFDHRIRLALEITEAVRKEWPESLPLFARISATDWVDRGWTVDESVELARRLHSAGVDLIDCSSGGTVPNASIPIGPGFQTGFAERIHREAGVATGAVGLITAPEQADHIIRTGQADLVLLAREMLRNPYWVLHASTRLGQDGPWPKQYLRAK